MNLTVTTDFFKGKKYSGHTLEIRQIIDELLEVKKNLITWPIDCVIDIIDNFSFALLERDRDIHRKHPGTGIPFVAHWCRRANIESLLDDALKNRNCLDSFIASESRPDREYRAFGRGFVVHWMAGNVPTLGFLSLIQGILTKNVNLIKLATNSDTLLPDLLELMSTLKEGDKFSGADLVRSFAVIRYDHSRRDIGTTISCAADVRIFWGSDDAVQVLSALPHKPEVSDVYFANKTSFILVDSNCLRSMEISSIARRVATDVSVFEQKACASPHTIFIETSDDDIVNKFAGELKQALQSTLRTIPKMIPTPQEVSAILNLRAQYDMFHRAWYSSGSEFSILSDDELKLGPAIGNRTVFIRKVESFDKVAELITPQVQSIGILADRQKYEHITALLGERGVQRFVPIGTMTNFESPWNGYFLTQSLIRWTSRPAFKE